LYNKLSNASHVSLVFEKHNSIETYIQPFPVKLHKNAPFFIKARSHNRPGLRLVVVARKYERTSLSLPFKSRARVVWYGLLFHMTQPTSRSIIKAIACNKPTNSEH